MLIPTNKARMNADIIPLPMFSVYISSCLKTYSIILFSMKLFTKIF